MMPDATLEQRMTALEDVVRELQELIKGRVVQPPTGCSA